MVQQEHSTPYLHTSSAEVLYESQGWKVIDRTEYEGDNVSIMKTNIRS